MQGTTYDAIVVGSGIAGGWAVKELAERGLRTLLLERGKHVEHVKDYVNATKPPWAYPHRGGRTREMKPTACQNPSPSYMAFSARAAAYTVDELNRRNL